MISFDCFFTSYIFKQCEPMKLGNILQVCVVVSVRKDVVMELLWLLEKGSW